jgi:rubredoxin
MLIIRRPFRCRSCDHLWDAETVNDAPAQLVIASWKALYCPNCGAGWRKLAFITQPDAKPPDA